MPTTARTGCLTAAVAALCLSGPPVAHAEDPFEIPFVVTDLNRQPVPEGVTQTLTLGKSGTLSGNAGCNTYSAGYVTMNGAILIQPARVTRMACPDPQMSAEQRFFALLYAVTSFDYNADENLLVLNGANGRPVMRLRRQEP